MLLFLSVAEANLLHSPHRWMVPVSPGLALCSDHEQLRGQLELQTESAFNHVLFSIF